MNVADYIIFPISCVVTNVVLDYKKYNGSPTVNGLDYAASCGGASSCTSIDLGYNDHPHKLNFRYKFTISSGEVFYTPDIEIELKCLPSSTIITPSFSEPLYYSFEQYTIGHNVTFNDFACAPFACCQGLVYTFATDNVQATPNG